MRRAVSGLTFSAVIAASSLVAGSAEASLLTFQSFFGNFGLSSDGWGGTDGNGVIRAEAPDGSTVAAAYLYSSLVLGFNQAPANVTLGGSSVTGYSSLGANDIGLVAHRADVTDIVRPIIESGGGGVYDFDISEGNQGFQIDGHALVVVYSHPSLPEASIGILDGFSDAAGDSTAINFASPLNVSDPGFFAEMRLGIGFSCCNQASSVFVNGNLLTENAGNNDDGEEVANGSLITVGGFDDPFSPLLPSYDEDTERYDLAASGFLNDGDTTIGIRTFNPSRDDNIFLAMFYVRGRAAFDDDPDGPAPIPLPASGLLLLTALGGLAAWRRRKAG
jgi:hypothetical protein